MTEDELDRIKKSFVRSSDECPMEVACLLTVMKYYGGQQDARTLAEWCKVDGKYTLMGMKQAAIRAGMEAEICLQNMEQLSTVKFLPYFLPSMISKYRDMWFVMAFMKAASLFGSRDSALCNIGKTK